MMKFRLAILAVIAGLLIFLSTYLYGCWTLMLMPISALLLTGALIVQCLSKPKDKARPNELWMVVLETAALLALVLFIALCNSPIVFQW